MTNRAILFLMVILLLATGCVFGKEEAKDGNRVVAVVNGTEIPYQTIYLSPRDALLLYQVERGSSAQPTPEALETYRKNKEAESLAARIKNKIWDEMVKRYNIQVTPEEITQRWAIHAKNVNVNEVVEKQRQTMGLQLEAFDAVWEQGKDKDTVYQEKLAGKLTKPEWELQLQFYRDPKMRQILRDELKKTAAEYEKPDPGLRTILINEKLNSLIDREIAKNDLRFRENQALVQTVQMGQDTNTVALKYVEEARNAWWQRQYSNAKIEIKDERFKNVMK